MFDEELLSLFVRCKLPVEPRGKKTTINLLLSVVKLFINIFLFCSWRNAHK